jgi:hypothetical protein
MHTTSLAPGHIPAKGELELSLDPVGTSAPLFKLYYPVHSKRWNVRTGPIDTSRIVGSYPHGAVVRGIQKDKWLVIEDGVGWSKLQDEVFMGQVGAAGNGYGWVPTLETSVAPNPQPMDPELLELLFGFLPTKYRLAARAVYGLIFSLCMCYLLEVFFFSKF